MSFINPLWIICKESWEMITQVESWKNKVVSNYHSKMPVNKFNNVKDYTDLSEQIVISKTLVRVNIIKCTEVVKKL